MDWNRSKHCRQVKILLGSLSSCDGSGLAKFGKLVGFDPTVVTKEESLAKALPASSDFGFLMLRSSAESPAKKEVEAG